MDMTTEAHSKSEHYIEEASSDAVEVEVRPKEVTLPASTLWVSSAGSEPEEVVTIYNMVDVETLTAPKHEKAQSIETYSIMEENPLNKKSSMGEITGSKVDNNQMSCQEDKTETVSLLTITDSNKKTHAKCTVLPRMV